MFAKTIFSGYISLAVIVLFMRHVFRSSAIQLLLGGLMSYYLLDPTKQHVPAQAKPEEAKSKKARKAAERQQQLEIQGAAQQIYCTPLYGSLRTLPLADDVNSLMTIGISLLLNALFVVLVAVVAGASDVLMMISVVLLLVAYMCSVLIKADYMSGSRKRVDQAVLLVVMALGTLAAFAMLTWAPGQKLSLPSAAGRSGKRVRLMVWDTAKATGGLNMIVNGLYERINARMQHAGSPLQLTAQASPVMLSAVMAACAGVLAVAMLGPALQFSRLLYSSQQVPEWGASYMRHSWLSSKATQLAFITPLLVTLSQVPALAGFLGLRTAQLTAWTGAGLMLVALTHCLAFRTLAQAYLNGGLKEWYTLLHNGFEFQGKMDVIRVRVELLRSMLGKVGLQLMALPLMALSCGLLLLLNSGALQLIAQHTAPARVAAYSRLPPALSHLLLNSSSTTVSMPHVPNVTVSINMTTSGGASNVTAGSVPAALTLEGMDPGTVTAMTAAPDNESAAARQPAAATAQVTSTDAEVPLLEGLTEDGTYITLEDSSSTAPSSKASSTDKQTKKRKAGMLAAGQSASQAGEPRDLWQFLSSFLGWWACATWSTYAVASLVVYRMGLNSG